MIASEPEAAPGELSRWARLGPRAVCAAGALSLAALAGVVSIATADADPARGRSIAAWLVVAALLVLALGLVARSLPAIGGAVLGLGAAEVVAHIHAGTSIPGPIVVVAPTLVLVAELAAWSVDLSPAVANEPGVLRERARWVASALVGATALTVLLVAVAGVDVVGDLPLDVIAVLAAIGVLGLVVALARR